MRAAYRLGVDIGANSLGWCVLDLDRQGRPRAIRRMGVRIFSDGRDPQSGTSLAVARRGPRQQRRRRDRYLDRRADLMRALVRHGLMPADAAERKALERLDPYELRARGLDEPLTPHQFGRALFHLNQRRGFLSNRKAERKADEKETGRTKVAIASLEQRMREAGARTLGEYLYRACREGRTVRGDVKGGAVEAMRPVRARLRGQGAQAQYDLYASRAMYEQEFDALWAAQSRFRPELGQDAKDELRDIIFHQRRLRPVDPGKCTFEPTERRAPVALPTAQRFRMLQELANLEVEFPDRTHRPLDRGERDRVLEKLERTNKLSFDGIRRLLALPSDARFNLESEKRKDLRGDATGIALSKKGRFGPAWWKLPLEQRDAIISTLLDEEDEGRLLRRAETEWELSPEAAQAVAAAPLPDGYMRLGRSAMGKIVALLEAKGYGEYRYADAAREAGYHHSDFRDGEILDQLPYYGEVLERYVAFGSGEPEDGPEQRFGRIANPTVHRGLNELRKVVNALLREYGRPEQIVVELARELKLGEQRKREIAAEQAENQKKNDARRQKIAELRGCPPENVSAEDVMKLRLWEELGPEPHARACVYTGEPISINRLFSDEVDVDHILPFARSLDNSPANRIVALRRANRYKGNRTPFEAFGQSRDGYDWQAILLRSHCLPKNKAWRFGADAMERLNKNGDFLDRHLTDTAYLARLTKAYLSKACDPDQVYVIPGRLTAMLRGKWGLNRLLSDHNQKNRTDHRHHAIDAFVVGVTDRSMLQQVAGAADEERDRLIADMPEPWNSFRDELKARLDRIVVSHKPDHGTQGKLHEETAYGIVADPAKEGGATLVSRKPIESLTPAEILRVRDEALRKALADEVLPHAHDKKALSAALAAFSARTGVRRVRLLKTEEKFIRVSGPDGRPYKAYIPGDNHHVEIYELPDGRWAGEAVTVFDANQPGYRPRWREAHPGARLVMRAHKGDLIKLEHDGKERIMCVVRLNAKAQRFYLAEHHEGGALADRHADPDDPFRWALISFNQLKTRGARKVTVDVLGRVRDPGPPE